MYAPTAQAKNQLNMYEQQVDKLTQDNTKKTFDNEKIREQIQELEKDLGDKVDLENTTG